MSREWLFTVLAVVVALVIYDKFVSQYVSSFKLA
jgi:hypothetical protein